MVTNTWQVFNTTTTNQYHAMLLQVMAFTANVQRHFKAVGQTHTAYFTQCRVWLFRCSGINARADTAFLRVALQSRNVALVYDKFSWLTNQLVDRRHENKLQ